MLRKVLINTQNRINVELTKKKLIGRNRWQQTPRALTSQAMRSQKLVGGPKRYTANPEAKKTFLAMESLQMILKQG